MAQLSKVSGVATKVMTNFRETEVIYHDTTVVKFDSKTVVLNSGGWRTVTTKTRMNQTSNQFGLGYRVYQKEGKWFVSYRGKTYDFHDDLRLAR